MKKIVLLPLSKRAISRACYAVANTALFL
jgi:hypothetical protein